MKKHDPEVDHLLAQATKIVTGLGRTLAPFCEVVLHDLRKPEASIIAIEPSISGRRIGDTTTELGMARLADAGFPDIVQNYPNRFPDGRAVKSTSIGLRDADGQCIGAICINMDISLFTSMRHVLGELTQLTSITAPVAETLKTRSLDELRELIERYAAGYNLQARALDLHRRRQLVKYLAEQGVLQLKGAAKIVAEQLGVSRASVYNDLKKQSTGV